MTNNTPKAELNAEPVLKDGERCFRIPLTGRDGVGRFALVDPEGFARLQRVGARALYVVSDGGGREYATFIRPGVKGRVYTAARVIAQAPDGQCVRYANGDRLDLRGANLRCKDGFAPGEAHLVATAEARRANAKIERPSEVARRSKAAVAVRPQIAA